MFQDTKYFKGSKGTNEAQEVWWRRCNVKYFHRTAHNFVLSAGLAVPTAKLSKDGSNCVRRVEASLSSFIEEVLELDNESIQTYCFK